MVLLVWLAGPGALLRRLAELDPGWGAAALLMALPPTALAAWRWRYTARRVGLDLPLGHAVREYWLGTFLNQVLPGGVAGDVGRAWRDGRERGPRRGRAWRVVVLERASGQFVVALVAAASLLALAPSTALAGALLLAGVLCLGGALVWASRAARQGRGPLARLGRRARQEVRRALLAPAALPVQLVTSGAVVACYMAIFVLGARAVGVTTPMPDLLPLVMPVLLAMLIPVSVAGWGVREGAAAAIWSLAGLPVADGVAASLAYGIVVLAGSLPGALFLSWKQGRPSATPGPRSRRLPGRNDASGAGGPPPWSPPAGG